MTQHWSTLYVKTFVKDHDFSPGRPFRFPDVSCEEGTVSLCATCSDWQNGKLVQLGDPNQFKFGWREYRGCEGYTADGRNVNFTEWKQNRTVKMG